ncbi:MAG: hypothetical protein OXM03_05155 [Chloroflexota bacterium]|nr:hypothetical protein [Chloroflexota bacterium]
MTTTEKQNQDEKKSAAQVIGEIEEITNSRVISFVGRRSLGTWDILPFHRVLAGISHQEQLSVIVQSLGEFSDDAFKLARVIREFGDEVSFIVPSVAKSAATLLCLSGDRILMGPTSELGPTNPMMYVDERLITPTVPEPGGLSADREEREGQPKQRQMAALALRDFLIAAGVLTSQGAYDPEKLSVYMTNGILNPFLLGDFERSGKTSMQYAETLLRDHMFKGKKSAAKAARETARKLCEGYFDHAYPIVRQEARDELNLNVEGMPDELFEKTSDLVSAYDRMLSDQNIARIIETSTGNPWTVHWKEPT